VIYISQDLDLALIEVKRDLLNYTIVDSRDREFLVEHANEAIKRAYITTSTPETIILVAPKFSIIAQNKLLKVLEEPPFNKEFILITKSKSSLLPTIKSRLPVVNLSKKSSIKENIELDLENLGEEEIYNFLKQRQKISKLEVKNILETFFLKILNSNSNRYKLDESLLNHFSKSIEALESGASPIFILTSTLLRFLRDKKD